MPEVAEEDIFKRLLRKIPTVVRSDSGSISTLYNDTIQFECGPVEYYTLEGDGE